MSLVAALSSSLFNRASEWALSPVTSEAEHTIYQALRQTSGSGRGASMARPVANNAGVIARSFNSWWVLSGPDYTSGQLHTHFPPAARPGHPPESVRNQVCTQCRNNSINFVDMRNAHTLLPYLKIRRGPSYLLKFQHGRQHQPSQRCTDVTVCPESGRKDGVKVQNPRFPAKLTS